MTRLNKSIREDIINNAIAASGVNTRQEALITRRAKLADDVRLFAIGGAERDAELNATYDKAVKYANTNSVEGFIDIEVSHSTSSRINVNFAGRAIDLYFTGKEKHCYSDNVSKPYVNTGYRNRVAITADNPLNDEFDAISKEQRSIDDLSTQVKYEVTAMVNSVTTTKKLLELWPEAKDLLPNEEKSQSTAIVADVNKLNVMLGLPKDEE